MLLTTYRCRIHADLVFPLIGRTPARLLSIRAAPFGGGSTGTVVEVFGTVPVDGGRTGRLVRRHARIRRDS